MAKLLYMAFFDRMKVSYKNGWFDEDLNVYIYYTLEDICESLQIGEKKAQALKKELRDTQDALEILKKAIGILGK